MNHIELIRSTLALPPPQRESIIGALKRLAAESDPAAYEAGLSIIAAYRRVATKRASDKATDAARRVLVGARVPRDVAARYRDAAAAQGLSLYAWVRAALEAAAEG